MIEFRKRKAKKTNKKNIVGVVDRDIDEKTKTTQPTHLDNGEERELRSRNRGSKKKQMVCTCREKAKKKKTKLLKTV